MARGGNENFGALRRCSGVLWTGSRAGGGMAEVALPDADVERDATGAMPEDLPLTQHELTVKAAVIEKLGDMYSEELVPEEMMRRFIRGYAQEDPRIDVTAEYLSKALVRAPARFACAAACAASENAPRRLPPRTPR